MSALRPLALALAALLALGPAAAQEGPEAQPAPGAAAAPRERVKQLMPVVETMRRLKFKRDVAVETQTPDDFREYAAREIDKDLPPERAAAVSKGLQAFGLLSRGYDLRAGLLDLVTSQAAAYYDPETKRFFVLMTDLPRDHADAFIFHELVHALQDQHFDLGAKIQALSEARNDDATTAFRFVVEGEATWLMTKFQVRAANGVDLDALPGPAQEALFARTRDMTRAQLAVGTRALVESLGKTGGGLARALAATEDMPGWLFWSLHAPYFRGQYAVHRVVREGGFAALEELYRRPPSSTEQMMHPEKLAPDARDEPVAVAIPTEAIAAALGPGWKLVHVDSLGELGTFLLLDEKLPPEAAPGAGPETRRARAAAGWDGDRYACFEGPEGALALVWKTAWDGPADAKEFAAAASDAGFPGARVVRETEVVVHRGLSAEAAEKAIGLLVPPAPGR